MKNTHKHTDLQPMPAACYTCPTMRVRRHRKVGGDVARCRPRGFLGTSTHETPCERFTPIRWQPEQHMHLAIDLATPRVTCRSTRELVQALYTRKGPREGTDVGPTSSRHLSVATTYRGGTKQSEPNVMREHRGTHVFYYQVRITMSPRESTRTD